MPELIAKSALDGRTLACGSLALAEMSVGPITSIAIYPGGAGALATGLQALGLVMPGPNEVTASGAARMFWTGRDQAFLIGVTPPALSGAALTDQSDGWTMLSLAGADAVEVLARLVPVDLRQAAFPVGRVQRSQLNHMNAVIHRRGESQFEIMVFRSMARTAWHELETAIQMVAARQDTKF